MKIVLLDDDPFALNLLTLQVHSLTRHSRERTEIKAYQRGGEALAVLEAEPDIGLVLCDLRMPEMDGVEFVRHLVTTGYAGDLAFISGETPRALHAAEQLGKAHGLRVLAALNKPVKLEQLRQLLTPLLPDAGAPAEQEHVCLPQDLARAIAGGELVNYYQPKVAMGNGAVSGVETLVRWQHPQHGLLAPANFITLAEEHGLIDGLTMVVLETALRDNRRLQDAGYVLDMAVNLSMTNLSSLELPDVVARMAAAAGVPVSRLVLEITESQLMTHPRAQLDSLIRLHLKKIGLSIDDFGTGYSSLAKLRDLPFDEMKLDRSFVHGASNDRALRAIVEVSLELARELGMQTVAEGVSDRADWDFMRRSGVGLAQGYFIGMPMPAQEIGRWMQEWESRRGELTAAQ